MHRDREMRWRDDTVVAILTTFEERFGFTVDDDEVDGQVFATVGTLSDFVSAKLPR